ncbi:hypothetical protein VKT23_020419 [Stygiomarasmius scandens]|uniref:CxC2-like cysteine cluster KDZ transposase-associated domain-containing protein n=1 Tax=Marasmiellus scandens TaxID=2682957 RepID=A0ABR1IMS2_9AGAR
MPPKANRGTRTHAVSISTPPSLIPAKCAAEAQTFIPIFQSTSSNVFQPFKRLIPFTISAHDLPFYSHQKSDSDPHLTDKPRASEYNLFPDLLDLEEKLLDELVFWDDKENAGVAMEEVAGENEVTDELASKESSSGSKRKARGDPVLRKWTHTYVDEYLSELVRQDGRGYAIKQDICGCCSSASVLAVGYRCLDCMDSQMYCRACVVKKHNFLPFHKIEQWTGSFFLRTTLHDLGHVLQLGHQSGDICMCSSITPLIDMTVLDIGGVHRLRVQFCNCHQSASPFVQLLCARLFPATTEQPRTAATFRLLEHFQLLGFVSKVSAGEYYSTLERLSNNITCLNTSDRYRELLRMMRQWRLLKVLKRHGRAHDPSGYKGTKEGECVVRCAACPHPGINLPADWRNAPDQNNWLYTLFLSMDANFRCVRLNVSSEAVDPSLFNGIAYMITPAIVREHMKNFGGLGADDISNCNNHKAVRLASMRRDAGLAVTGLATTDCGRHDAKLPRSMCDMQAGERQANMDLCLLCHLEHTEVERVCTTYDIMCQYLPHLPNRVLQYPENLRPRFLGTSFVGLVPKFHLPAHQEKCRLNFNLNYCKRVGRTNGEGVERGWSNINALAGSTKHMGPGSRSDTLDDHFGAMNWRKRTLYSKQFYRWATENAEKLGDAVRAFQAYNQGVDEETREKWREAVEDWEEDPDGKVNPYQSTVKPTTFHKARLVLAQEEAKELEKSTRNMVATTVSESAFLVEGLEVREQQRRLQQEMADLSPHATDLTRSKVLERVNTLRRRLEAWCSLQALLFPAAVIVRSDMMSSDAYSTCDVPLLLPSELIHHSTCSLSAIKIQWELEYAQAHDMLNKICEGLLTRTYLYTWKRKYTHGQRDSTSSSRTIAKVQAKINSASARYRIARLALSNLASHMNAAGWDTVLRELRREDIRPLNPDNFDPNKEAAGNKEPSWIWCTANGGGKEDMQDALRMAWCKARARAHRYQEECLLLQEEMRRVLKTFEFEAEVWHSRALAVEARELSPECMEGQRAYALYQKHIREAMARDCRSKWSTIPATFTEGEGAIPLDNAEYNFV